jgi:hypothetical protein
MTLLQDAPGGDDGPVFVVGLDPLDVGGDEDTGVQDLDQPTGRDDLDRFTGERRPAE